MAVAVEVVSSTEFTTSNTPVWLVMEGLMAHFFSPVRQHYTDEDVQWFLNFTNKKKQWCFQGNLEVVIEGSQDSWTGKPEKSTTALQTEVNSLLFFHEGRRAIIIILLHCRSIFQLRGILSKMPHQFFFCWRNWTREMMHSLIIDV